MKLLINLAFLCALALPFGSCADVATVEEDHDAALAEEDEVFYSEVAEYNMNNRALEFSFDEHQEFTEMLEADDEDYARVPRRQLDGQFRPYHKKCRTISRHRQMLRPTRFFPFKAEFNLQCYGGGYNWIDLESWSVMASNPCLADEIKCDKGKTTTSLKCSVSIFGYKSGCYGRKTYLDFYADCCNLP